MKGIPNRCLSSAICLGDEIKEVLRGEFLKQDEVDTLFAWAQRKEKLYDTDGKEIKLGRGVYFKDNGYLYVEPTPLNELYYQTQSVVRSAIIRIRKRSLYNVFEDNHCLVTTEEQISRRMAISA